MVSSTSRMPSSPLNFNLMLKCLSPRPSPCSRPDLSVSLLPGAASGPDQTDTIGAAPSGAASFCNILYGVGPGSQRGASGGILEVIEVAGNFAKFMGYR